MTTTWFDELREILLKRPHSRFDWPGVELRASAVLVPLFLREGKVHAVFTRRPMHLRTHAGQISFPGGSRDDTDASLEATALREAQEEIGLRPELVRLLGPLDEIATPTMFRISPYVGVIPEDLTFSLSSEVEEILEVPLHALMDKTCQRVEMRSFFDREFEVHYFHHGSHTIWGATGRIVNDLLKVVANLPFP